MNVLNEVMEDMNMQVKELPVHQDDESQTLHSPNVTFARRSIIFQKNEYKRSTINFKSLIEDGVITLRKIHKSKYIEQRKQIEKKQYLSLLQNSLEMKV